VKLPSWSWSALIGVSAVAAGLASLGPSGHPLRSLVESWFLLVCPGMALVRLLRLGSPLAEWCLAVALSLALDALLPDVMVYAGVWSTRWALMGLIGLSLMAASLRLVRRSAFA
jgi:hypothetical protein